MPSASTCGMVWRKSPNPPPSLLQISDVLLPMPGNVTSMPGFHFCFLYQSSVDPPELLDWDQPSDRVLSVICLSASLMGFRKLAPISIEIGPASTFKSCSGLVANISLVKPLIFGSPLFSAVDIMSGGTSWKSNPQSVRWISPLKNRPQLLLGTVPRFSCIYYAPAICLKSALGQRATLISSLSNTIIRYSSTFFKCLTVCGGDPYGITSIQWNQWLSKRAVTFKVR